MAARTILTDDITPSVELPEGSTTTSVSVTDSRDSFAFDIDLGDENFKKLVTALRKYRENGREVTIRISSKTSNGTRDSASDGPVIRKWAQDNPTLLGEGVKVPGDRGALSKDVIAAYDAHYNEHASVEAIEAAMDAGEAMQNSGQPEF